MRKNMKSLVQKQTTQDLILQLEELFDRNTSQETVDIVSDVIYEELEARHPKQMDIYFGDMSLALAGVEPLKTLLAGL